MNNKFVNLNNIIVHVVVIKITVNIMDKITYVYVLTNKNKIKTVKINILNNMINLLHMNQSKFDFNF